MDAINLGLQALEAAIHSGATLVSGVDHLVQAAADPGAATCEICRCDW